MPVFRGLVNVEIIPADIDVVLISETRKAGAKFQEKFGDVLDQCIFDVALHHILAEMNRL